MNPLAAGLLAASCLAMGCEAHAKEAEPESANGKVLLTPQQMQSAKISVATVSVQEVDAVVATSGHVTFDDLKVSHVFSPVTGRVTRILANPGEQVKKGAPLAVIESPDVGSAFADLGKAQADLLAAEHEFNRQKDLFADHAAAQKDYEAAEDNYRKAQAELARAEQKARMLRSGTADKVTQEYTLRALIDGTVVARSINPGAEVQGQYAGGQAQELFTIGELDPLWVMADLFEVDLARVKVGAPVKVSVVAYPHEQFAGRVDWISDALDPATRSAKVRCVVPNPEHKLKPEMYASAAISASGHEALAVPREAVLRLADQTVVFVEVGTEADGRVRFERRPVGVDEDSGAEVVPVLRGLQAGDRVVTTGAILLSEMGQS